MLFLRDQPRSYLALTQDNLRPEVGELWPERCADCRDAGFPDQYHKVQSWTFENWDEEGPYTTNVVVCDTSGTVSHLMYLVGPVHPYSG